MKAQKEKEGGDKIIRQLGIKLNKIMIGETVKTYTVLISAGTKQEIIETIQADDFESAINWVKEKYPEKAFRLIRGKKIPQKEPPAKMKKKPTNTWANKK